MYLIGGLLFYLVDLRHAKIYNMECKDLGVTHIQSRIREDKKNGEQ